MMLQHVNVKIFVDGPLEADLRRFIEVFHVWVSEQSTGELLIDVADYRHVPDGPSVMLVGHEADYAIDNTGGRCGLVYNRKAPLEGQNQDRFRQALAAAAAACERLEAEVEGLRFSRTELQLSINDRALAPNTPETLAAVQPELESFLGQLVGEGNVRIEHDADPRRRFGVAIELSQPLDLAALAGAQAGQ